MKLDKLTQDLVAILRAIEENESFFESIVKGVHQDNKISAKNLLRYLVLRSYNLREYHGSLSELGLSALRSGEGYVYSMLTNVINNLHLIDGKQFKINKKIERIGYTRSKSLLIKNANKLFNHTHKDHFTEIMVTLPNEAADDESIIHDMIINGMEVARINLSHGDIDIWTRMVKIINKLKKEHRYKVRIYMDLSGPKMRTTAMQVTNHKNKIKESIPIRQGEHIILTKRNTLGAKSTFGKQNEQLTKGEVGVQLKNIVDDVQIGNDILFDDGMIKGIVVDKSGDDVEVTITECYKSKLGARKGINLPDTVLNLPALTDTDIELLPFVCEHADIVGYSFVRTPSDVAFLYDHLNRLGAGDIGVVFKIENKEAFENLPEIILEGMKRDMIGVMIARGDLAVEIGFERISEVQNQILWICEAAHIPVIWATQVLENMAKNGIPTRAEVSDASMSANAECVMLNKGPYINRAIKTLHNILIRMEDHSFKKKNELRELKIATNSLERILQANS